jgi:cell division transport system permease protein
MLWTNTKRVMKAGFVNFWRNGFVSVASILIMTITLCVIGSIIFVSTLLNSTLDTIKDKVDVTAYFVTTAAESDIHAIEDSLTKIPEVKSVAFRSRDAVLAEFKQRHQSDGFNDAFDELNDNPLGAELNIKVHDPSQIPSVETFVKSKGISPQNGLSIVSSVSSSQERNKIAIERLVRIIDAGHKIGFFLTIILIVLSVVVTFNTIRLAIYISREEISVMRLVGASSKYVRGPFVVVGVMYGVVATLVTLAIFYPVTYYLGKTTENFANNNVYLFYIQHFGPIFGILLGSGILIGGVSSYLAVRRYLKV